MICNMHINLPHINNTALTAAIFLALLGMTACDTTTDDTDAVVCGAPSVRDAEVGELFYELIDLQTRTVWGTPDLTPEQFNALELPDRWAKNQIREGQTDDGRFLRTPDCDSDGKFTEEMLFGFRFQHIVNLVSTNESIDEAGLLHVNQVFKYHELEFHTDSAVSILESPAGTRYIMVSRDAARTTDTPNLPIGWSITDYDLTADLTVELFDVVDNIRADNEDSFQGPLPQELNLDRLGD